MTTTLSPDHLGQPPPLQFDLTDGHVVVGWVSNDRVGFRGFADETEAVHAAWLAWRTIARRVARRDGTRPVPIDTEPLALRRTHGRDEILASGKPIAVLIRPGDDSSSGADSFGFELQIAPPVDELRLRSKAHLVYRALRKSGIRWSLWRRDERQHPPGHSQHDGGESHVARHSR